MELNKFSETHAHEESSESSRKVVMKKNTHGFQKLHRNKFLKNICFSKNVLKRSGERVPDGHRQASFPTPRGGGVLGPVPQLSPHLSPGSVAASRTQIPPPRASSCGASSCGASPRQPPPQRRHLRGSQV